jgi:outer membrane lipoprotein SlyB
MCWHTVGVGGAQTFSLASVVSGFLFHVWGCAYNGPAAPSFAAMPGPHKSYESFQGDDHYCQNSAQQAIGYNSPGQAANDAAVGTAVVGTALGALAGAALGSAAGHAGTGAAVGAGTGLIAGSAVGSRNAAVAGGSMQARYDTVYASAGCQRQSDSAAASLLLRCFMERADGGILGTKACLTATNLS